MEINQAELENSGLIKNPAIADRVHTKRTLTYNTEIFYQEAEVGS